MYLVLLIVINIALMTTLFLYGVYQFMQVEEKRKRNQLQLDSRADIAELEALLGQNRYEEALQHLMTAADVDRFTAESALEQLKKDS